MVQALICHWHCKLNPHCFKRPVKFDLSVPVQLKQRRPPKFKLNFPACLSHLPPFFPVKWTLSCNNSDLSHWDADTITQILLCPFEMPWQGHWFRNTSTVNLYIWTHRFCEVFLFAFSIRGKSELLDKNSWESLRGGHKKADRKTMSLADEAERGWICSRDEWECVTVRGQLTSVTPVGKGVRDCICLWVCMCVLRRSPWGEEDQREMEWLWQEATSAQLAERSIYEEGGEGNIKDIRRGEKTTTPFGCK